MTRRLTSLTLFAALTLGAPALAQTAPQSEVVVTGAGQPQDEVVVTGGSVIAAESPDALRVREAIAYANPMPAGAPDGDYPLVAWCEALVRGHVALGETLTDPDDLDRDIMRLGLIEADSFRAALTRSEARQTPATKEAARDAAVQGVSRFTALMTADDLARDQAFGLFFGLPGRCEHAARRLTDNIATPPATPAEVGLE